MMRTDSTNIDKSKLDTIFNLKMIGFLYLIIGQVNVW